MPCLMEGSVRTNHSYDAQCAWARQDRVIMHAIAVMLVPASLDVVLDACSRRHAGQTKEGVRSMHPP